jgi:hypothetical protein
MSSLCLGFVCSGWLLPLAVGSYISISMRSMMVSIALTGVVTWLWLGMWMEGGVALFAFNPLWTTLPICIALLVASRLRTADWLREKRTWRSRFSTLTPVFVAVVVIITVIPAVRVYSVPFVSFAEIEAELNKISMPEGLSQEERTIMFREMEARLSLPLLTQEERDALHEGRWRVRARIRLSIMPKNFDSLPPLEQSKISAKIAESTLAAEPPFEVTLAHDYEFLHRNFNSDNAYSIDSYIINFYTNCPWEKARALRIGHLLLFATLQSIKKGKDVHSQYFYGGQTGIVDSITLDTICPWNTSKYFFRQRDLRLNYVVAALKWWYLEHNNTLPKSLDELVGEYIKTVPNDPLTGKAMRYEPNQDDKLLLKERSHRYNRPGWQHIEIGGRIRDLDFLPGYKGLENVDK